jgi:predicted metal-dependent hydrolase
MISDPEIIETPAGPAMLRRAPRQTLAISVLPDGAIELIAPSGASQDAVSRKVGKRVRWIRKQRLQFRQWHTDRKPLRYVSGATHRYLGRQYLLKVIQGSQPHVRLQGARLCVELPTISESQVRKALEEWYRSHAKQQFTRRLARWEAWCRSHKLPMPRLGLRSMLKRWGSAQKNGLILLNPQLIRASSACVDYVITHEIVHLRHPNHGPKFWTLLKQLCPSWQELKNRLEQTEVV